jgi:predicted phosphodiesterase
VRVAALYDVHGNLPALEAVLAEVAREGVDVVVSGGDVAAGPMPVECLDLLAALGPQVVYVRGNGDRELVARRRGDVVAPTDAAAWVAAAVRPEHVDVMASWPLTATLDVDGLGRTLFCHTVPYDDVSFFLETTEESQAAEILGPVDADALVCGHTHMQFDRVVGGVRVINAGSVGMPYEAEPGAYWALLGPDVSLRRTPYDVDAAAARIRATAWPGAEEFARENVVSVPTAAEARAAFEPSVGRT